MNSETIEHTGLSSHDFAPSYRTGQCDPVDDFYKPCIEHAKEYDRAVGYFRSTIYLVIGDSIVDFAKRGGKIRLICSPMLYEDDATSIESAYEERQSKLASAVEQEIDQMLGTPNGMYHTKVLATLVLVGSLDIKLALRRANQGLYHEKIGIFRDDKNAVSFIGSANETWSGWHERGNFESLEVFCTWRDANEKERVRRHEDYFNKLWNGKVLGVTVVQFPEAARKRLIQYAHQSLDEIDIGQMRNIKKEIRIPLKHQTEAIANWEMHDRRGVLEHATGSGKTITAIIAIKKHVSDGLPAIILVPSCLLLEQWDKEILEEIPHAITLLAGGGNNGWKKGGRLKGMTSSDAGIEPRIIITTIRTASTHVFRSRIAQGSHLMIVADEVHQTGSMFNSNVFSIDSGPRLGLSATPYRYGDPEGTAKIFDYFGQIIPPRFTLQDAIKAGRLVEYEYHPHPVYLTADEADEWKSATARIRLDIARGKVDEGGRKIISDRAKMMLIQRSRIAKKALNKLHLAIETLKESYEEGQRWLVYCEDVEQLKEVMEALATMGLHPMEYHSSMGGDRQSALEWFMTVGGILVSIKCLDEGIDMPAVDHALILASSQNPRQFIQRRGRVLRKAEGKSIAVIHDAIVVPLSLEDEPDQYALLKSELLRAIEFANSALNLSAGVELRGIAARLGLDPDTLVNDGIEEDEA